MLENESSTAFSTGDSRPLDGSIVSPVATESGWGDSNPRPLDPQSNNERAVAKQKRGLPAKREAGKADVSRKKSRKVGALVPAVQAKPDHRKRRTIPSPFVRLPTLESIDHSQTQAMLDAAENLNLPIGPVVYFLIQQGVVVYVGKSMTLGKRLAGHQNDKGPKSGFDEVRFIRSSEDKVDALEAEWILRLKPKLNTITMAVLRYYAGFGYSGDRWWRWGEIHGFYRSAADLKELSSPSEAQ